MFVGKLISSFGIGDLLGTGTIWGGFNSGEIIGYKIDDVPNKCANGMDIYNLFYLFTICNILFSTDRSLTSRVKVKCES